MILVDTNILVAVANSRDNQHQLARNLLEGLPDRLLVPPTVIAEFAICSASGQAPLPRWDSCGPARPAIWSWQS